MNFNLKDFPPAVFNLKAHLGNRGLLPQPGHKSQQIPPVVYAKQSQTATIMISKLVYKVDSYLAR